ncbi:metallophosphoesterase [Crenobacter intestini]|uniref:Serine/threonine protein phosphatase n=1 Tax=Crenobacter intestini TaxID=2563443 RepID=A0A4T0UJ29_9NEIS|nr:metallophosphoesterase [Crenobacter intestini]TIC78550.1 serine/threonine protein phosphatase [Crenobacter intestini]
MRIHLLSDLHNEFGEPYQPAVADADVTVLAGDIASRGAGVAWAREAFSGTVLYVPGNHEFYKALSMDMLLADMREDGDERVRVLDQDVIVIGDVRFIAAIGWTDFESAGDPEVAMAFAAPRMNDYRFILAESDQQFAFLSPQEVRRRALVARAWLAEQIAQPFDGKTVVVTHHAPSLRSTQPKYQGHGIVPAFCNDWERLFDGVDYWLHGHTHYAVNYVVGDTRVISNPKGYGRETTGFDPRMVIEV